MNKQEFVLNELRSIACDMSKLVENETENSELRQRQQAAKTVSLPGGRISHLGEMYDPNNLREELEYLLARLRSVNNYLFGDRTDLVATTKFLAELSRKLTS
jgi:hypothetical protein